MLHIGQQVDFGTDIVINCFNLRNRQIFPGFLLSWYLFHMFLQRYISRKRIDVRLRVRVRFRPTFFCISLRQVIAGIRLCWLTHRLLESRYIVGRPLCMQQRLLLVFCDLKLPLWLDKT